MPETTVAALVALGFTVLEAEIYSLLLQESPVTGYRVAQALGKPVANVYKAIEALAKKGAVLIEEGTSRLCRAVPPDELLGQLERRFHERRAAAEKALVELQPAPADERVYQLRSRDQVLERCRSMLSRSRQLVLLDSFPDPLDALRPDIEATVARGVKVAVMTYVPAQVEGAQMVLFPREECIFGSHPGRWIILVVDGAEHLVAYLSPDGREVRQGIWSGSLYLSCLLQGFMISEFVFVATLHDPETPPAVREVVRRHGSFYPREVPGYDLLLRRLTPAGTAPPPTSDD